MADHELRPFPNMDQKFALSTSNGMFERINRLQGRCDALSDRLRLAVELLDEAAMYDRDMREHGWREQYARLLASLPPEVLR